MTCQPLIGEYYKLSLLEEAIVLYNTQGADFSDLVNYYIRADGSTEKYFFGGPEYLLMGEVREDEEGRYWHIAYAAHRNPKKALDIFWELAPFPLDRVEFCRYQKMHNENPYKIYSWKTLERITKYHGITKSTPSTPTPSCAASSSSTTGS